jgi:hypothetical protein
MCLALAAAAPADITSGLVGYWPLDGDAQDASGNDLHGTISKVTPAADRMGYADSAMSFTGAADCSIRVEDSPKLQITGEMTLSAWVLLNGTNTNNSRILAKSGGGGARSWSLNIEATSGGVKFPATFQVAVSGSTNVSAVDTKPLTTDEWVHMAGVYRPGEVMEVYVNGELHVARTDAVPGSQHSNNSLPVMIGARNACTNCGWNGLIDEARVYGRALSATEINELVNFHPSPRVKAWSPSPADGAEDVATPLLGWKAGVTAVLHNIYVGQDPNLTEANLSGAKSPLLMHWYAPGLEPGKTYYWRVDEIEADGQTIHTGDVWSFMALPLNAYHPEPADGANTASLTPTLTWRAGKSAVQHHVYFGDSADAVSQGATGADKGAIKETTFAAGALESATKYYWRVDEIGLDGTVQAGPVWSFATILSVENFESYTDVEGGLIYETWIDGFTNGLSGSTVGNINAPFAEQTVVHGGKQSMPMDYNNVNAPFYSEAERSWSTPQDWTANAIDTLVLYVRGRSNNSAEKLYVVLEDSSGRKGTVTYPDAAVFTATSWVEWKIALGDFGTAGVNLARIKKVYLGVGDRANPVKGGAGRIYIDDICLTRP